MSLLTSLPVLSLPSFHHREQWCPHRIPRTAPCDQIQLMPCQVYNRHSRCGLLRLLARTFLASMRDMLFFLLRLDTLLDHKLCTLVRWSWWCTAQLHSLCILFHRLNSSLEIFQQDNCCKLRFLFLLVLFLLHTLGMG